MKASSIEAPAATLSGGNQQKVVLGKWLALQPRVIVFDEPTQGVDVGAKAEIHRLIRRLADEGAAVVMISSDMEEIVAESDRVAVMHEGRITGILDRADVHARIDHAAGGGVIARRDRPRYDEKRARRSPAARRCCAPSSPPRARSS